MHIQEGEKESARARSKKENLANSFQNKRTKKGEKGNKRENNLTNSLQHTRSSPDKLIS
jgi:hypothetical protein